MNKHPMVRKWASPMSAKYAALRQQDQFFWDAALAAICNNPNLRGKVTLDLITSPAPEINAIRIRVILKRRGLRWHGTLYMGADQLCRAYSPGEMMVATFSRAFAGAGRN